MLVDRSGWEVQLRVNEAERRYCEQKQSSKRDGIIPACVPGCSAAVSGSPEVSHNGLID